MSKPVAVRFTPEQFAALWDEKKPGERMSDTLRRIVAERYAAQIEADTATK